MGLFGDDNDGQSKADVLLTEQIEQSRAELEAKRKGLYDTQLRIVKSQGGEQWESNKGDAVINRDPKQPVYK